MPNPTRYHATLAVAGLFTFALALLLQVRLALPFALIVVLMVVGVGGFFWHTIALLARWGRRS